MVSAVLTVFYDGQFWTGIYDRTDSGKLQSVKVVFGAELQNGDIYLFTLKNYYRLAFGAGIEDKKREKRVNPKRMIKNAAKEIKNAGKSTKSQQALQMEREKLKDERTAMRREKRALERERILRLKRQKKKEKHRGR